MKKKVIYALVLITIVGGCGALYAHIAGQRDADPLTSPPTVDTPVVVLDTPTVKAIDTIQEITIACVGDMVLGINYPDNAPLLPVHDGKHLFDGVKEYLVSADIAVGNLECTLLDKGGTCRRVNNPKYAYFFRSPERYVEHFVNAGFDFLSIGNNHLRDFGEEGVVSTMRVLDQAGIVYAGLKDRAELAVLEKDGIRYGFCAFAPFIDMCDIHDYDLVRKNIRILREEMNCDLVIVSHHGGAEGSGATRVTRKEEWFGGGHRGNVYEFSHVCIDAGADLVVGCGPHVLRAMELYKGKLIAYSLGNFCTPYKMNISGISSYAPVLVVKLNGKGNFAGGQIVSARQFDRTGPKLDASNLAAKEIKRLTQLDFPKTKLKIADDGTLSY
jgi:hypothetical protein